MRIRNDEADFYLSVLKLISIKVTGKLGYAVARNMRALSISLKEYTEVKNNLISKYGEDNGNEIELKAASENFKLYQAEIAEYASIEHDVDIMQVEAETVFNSPLTADILSNIMFMIKDGEDNA